MTNTTEIEKTKLRIYNVLDQLIEEKPVSQISVRELVDCCHISRQTFYRHFEDIYALLLWVFDYSTTGTKIFDMNKDFEESCVVSFNNIAKKPKLYRQLFLDSKNQPFCDRFLRSRIDYSKRQIGARFLTDDVSFAVELYWSGYLHMLKKWLGSGMKISPEKMGKCAYESLPANMRKYYH